jgi:hypothetical protein
MKSARMGMILAIFAALSCFGPELGWATRVFTSIVTGTVTATPTRTDIEVDHQIYHFKPDSAADKQATRLRKRPRGSSWRWSRTEVHEHAPI